MELRQIRYFLTLAEHRHFGKAAAALHIAQPSLSQQIRVLEEELGTVLFDRSRRHVALTPDGDALIPYARRLVALAHDARQELADRSELRRGRIRLGVTPTVGGYLLPVLLRRFNKKHPGLELSITEDGSAHLAQELERGHLDLALLVEDPQKKDIAFKPFMEEEIVVALPQNHPLGAGSEIALTDLRDEPFIIGREGYHLRGLTLDACGSAGFAPLVAVSGTDVDTALRFVEAELGVTLIPMLVAQSVKGIATLSLSEPRLHRSIGIAWNPNRYLSKAASALRSFLRTAW